MPDESPSVLKVRCPSCTQKLDVGSLTPFSIVQCPSCRGQITVPKRFGTLILEELVGVGRVATVFRGLDMRLDREVAVRVLNRPIKEDEQQADLFLAEARKIAAFTHNRIVPIYSCGDAEGKAFLVMQYMSHLSIAHRLRITSGGLPIESSLQMMMAIITGLEAAYRQGVLHRNLNPSNFLLDADDEPKTGDFGLAAAAWVTTASVQENLRTCFTTTAYMSPEKGLGESEDVRSDIYALGATLYHMITGKAPFANDASPEAFALRRREPPVSPRVLRPEITKTLENLILAMLTGHAEARPYAYSDLLSALESCRPLSGRARRQAPGMRLGPAPVTPRPVVAPEAAAAPESAPGAAEPAQPRGNGLFAPAIVLLLALFIGLAVIAAMRRAPWYVNFVEPWVKPVMGAGVPSGGPGAAFQNPPGSVPPLAVPAPVETPAMPAGIEPPAATPVTPEPAAPAPAVVEPVAPAPAAAEQPAPVAPATPDMPPAVEPAPGTGAAPAAVPEPAPVEDPPPAVPAQALVLPAELQQQRPTPDDLNFFRVKRDLQAYLDKVPPAARPGEKEKIRQLSQLRPYLIVLLKTPYDDPEQGIRLRNGTVLKGSLIANENEVVVRPKHGRFRELKWSELAFEQYPAFFEFYIRQRLEHANPVADGKNDAATGRPADPGKRVEISQDYFRLALLCEWYGKTDEARRYAGKALNLDPGLRGGFDALLPGILAAPSPAPK